jgi:nucleoid-associated protein YgaU
MNKIQEFENAYLNEIKSLLKDRFFVILLGISVVVLVTSALYSTFKPREMAIASGENNSQESMQNSESSTDENTIAGLDTQDSMVTIDKEFELVKSDSPDTARKTDESGTYIVKSGDTLWSIAEQYFGSGYNYVDIASANKIADASMIDVGQKISIPNTPKKESTVGEISADATSVSKADQSAKTHTVIADDTLWDISVRYFGSGYEWVRLAQMNHIQHPDIIYADQAIKLRN